MLIFILKLLIGLKLVCSSFRAKRDSNSNYVAEPWREMTGKERVKILRQPQQVSQEWKKWSNRQHPGKSISSMFERDYEKYAATKTPLKAPSQTHQSETSKAGLWVSACKSVVSEQIHLCFDMLSLVSC